tara:strand:- start:180 stop:662 length:483 start_codon:yes stop_codon:yes gene_type:complete
MVNIFEQPPFFDSFIDQVNSLFFNYNNNYKEFMERNPNELMKLPFYTDNSEVLYYGGDYIIISDPDNKNYIFYFIIPGHNNSTIEVTNTCDKLIVKSKDYNADTPVKKDSTYNFYKVVSLTKNTFKIKEAVCSKGILSIVVMDTQKNLERQVIEIKNTHS